MQTKPQWLKLPNRILNKQQKRENSLYDSQMLLPTLQPFPKLNFNYIYFYPNVATRHPDHKL